MLRFVSVKSQIIQSVRLSVQSSELGPPTYSPASKCCYPPLGPRGRHTRLRGSGFGDPIPMKGQTFWYSIYTINYDWSQMPRIPFADNFLTALYTFNHYIFLRQGIPILKHMLESEKRKRKIRIHLEEKRFYCLQKRCQAILMQMVDSSVKASSEWRVPSLPLPDSLHPPKGISRLLHSTVYSQETHLFSHQLTQQSHLFSHQLTNRLICLVTGWPNRLICLVTSWPNRLICLVTSWPNRLICLVTSWPTDSSV